MSLTGIRPKLLIRSEYYNYPEENQYPEYIIQEYDIQTEQHDMIERQIKTYTLLSRHLQEERGQVIKQNDHTEHDDPFNCHIDGCQVKLKDNYEPISGTEDKPFVIFNTHQLSDYHDE